jgi:hypothetical protein
MWGTDWTRAVGMLTYKQGVDALRIADRLSQSASAAFIRHARSADPEARVRHPVHVLYYRLRRRDYLDHPLSADLRAGATARTIHDGRSNYSPVTVRQSGVPASTQRADRRSTWRSACLEL